MHFFRHGTLSFLVGQAVAYLLYPLLAWLPDIYFIRYKFVLISFITMIATTVVMANTMYNYLCLLSILIVDNCILL